MTKRLEKNQVICGDFYDELLKVQMKSVDMILTDLPYNITQNKWETELDLRKMWDLFHHVLKDTGVICLTSVQPFTSKLVMSNPNEFKHEWIWEKDGGSNFANTVREPMKEHESVLIFSKGKWTYNPIKQERIGSRKGKTTKSQYKTKTENYGKFVDNDSVDVNELRVPRSIQRFTRERGLHPTQKPTLLFEYLINTYTNENDTVLDCCAGSGTTAIACLNTNRNYICIEKEPKYYDIIKERIEGLTQ
jgi:site-specific DNA-methyltransferase (adenine-specific)